MKLRVWWPSPQISISCFAAEFGVDHLAANGGGSFLAAAVPGAMRAIDIVVAGHAGLEAEVLPEVAAHAFAEEFFPAIAILRHRGIGVGFLEGGYVGIALFVRIVDAGAGGIKEALDARFLRGDQHVGVDQHAEHAERLVIFDEAHPAHVGGKLVDVLHAIGGGPAFIQQRKIAADIFHVPRGPDTIRRADDGRHSRIF